MIWLGIDTSNVPLSVAVVQNGQLVAEWTNSLKVTHSIGAMPAIEDVLKKVNLRPGDLDAVAVSEGPGSYTGVRIGVTIAKTLAWSLKIPLVGVSSLQTLAGNAFSFQGFICPIMDARRNHVFSSLYSTNMDSVIQDGHYAIETIIESLSNKDEQILFVGKDVDLHWDYIQSMLGNRAIRAPFFCDLPRASVLINLAIKKQLPSYEETHQFVPQYSRIAEAEANWNAEQLKAGKVNE